MFAHIEVGDSFGGVNEKTDSAIACRPVEVMPCPKIKERTMGNVAGLGDELDGAIPQCQVGHYSPFAYMPAPQNRVVVNSHISVGIYARLESTREVKAD